MTPKDPLDQLEIKSIEELIWLRDEIDKTITAGDLAKALDTFATPRGLLQKLREFRSRALPQKPESL